ncbi:MAG: peptidylprolyl isomerase [Planctomycetaceae bacterium]
MIPVLLLASSCLLSGNPAAEDVIATVNGTAVTAQDLRVYLVLRGLPADVSPAVRSQAIGRLVDRALIRQFLERHKSTAAPDELAAAVRQSLDRLRREEQPPEPSLETLGVDEARLAAEMAVPVAWRRHAARVVTDEQIRGYFASHRQRLDGTRLRVSQIFRKYVAGESIETAPASIAALKGVRESISNGTTSFAEAARKNSQSPTAEAGGDVGWIDPQGDLPASVTRAAFALKPVELSEVVLSPFGAHLVTVTDVEAGESSLEDARPAILAELSDALWNETVAAERKTAKIEMHE